MLDKQNLRTFVLGGLAGAIAGILLTPRSGRELRGSLASRAGEVREKGRETYFDAREKAQERFSGKGEVYHQDPPEEPAWEEPLQEADPPLENEATVGRTPSGAIPMPGDSTPSRPPLRDVSRDVSPEPSDKDAEDLKRRIEATRDRLRRRREVSGEDRDV